MTNQRWIIATGNAGKLAEFQALLAPSGVTIESQAALNIASVAETGATFVENALLKARHASSASGLPALADDSGLCVAALDGAPGLHSARFAGPAANDQENISQLLTHLDGVPTDQRSAFFICVIVALRSARDPAPAIAIGRWHGRVLTAPQGNYGFGYDPIFYVPELGISAAEMPPADKNRVSHRAQAFAALQDDWPNLT